MALTAAKCINCGANLQIDNTKDAAVCEFCGAAFVVDKAINNYNIANAQISAQTVNVNVGGGDFVIRGGVLEKYKGAVIEITIPNGVVAIGKDAFGGFDRITSVTFSEGVEGIEPRAFSNCTCLEKVVLPKSLKKIGAWAFQHCGLTEIVIPENVRTIENGAFDGCYRIKRIIIFASDIIDQNGYGIIKDGAITIFAPIFSDVDRKNKGSFLGRTCLSGVDLVWEGSGAEKYTIIGTKTINGSPTREPGCYIATAVYGSYDAPQVLVLRHFRDNTLSESAAGRLFIQTYYRLSPPIARWLKNTRRLNAAVRCVLDRFVAYLSTK
jgi:hypothetical protein